MFSITIVLFPLLFLSLPSGRAEAFSANYVKKTKPNLPTLQAQTEVNSRPLKLQHDLYSRNKLSTATSIMAEINGGGDVKPSHSFGKKLLAEAMGTFIIVHLGCGVVCSAIFQSAQQGLWQVAAVWTIAVTLAIYSTAGISGAHLNPAITIAMKVCRPVDHEDMGWGKVLQYCMAQTFGAVVAAAVNLGLFWESIIAFESGNNIVRGAANSVASAAAFGEYWSVGSWQQAFLAESIGTFMLSFFIFSFTNSRNEAVPDKFAPVLIGATVGSLISVIAPLTQAGFNPARDFGPRIVSWIAGWGRSVAMQGWWVYVFGPVVGAVLGGLVAEKVLWKAE